MIVNVGLLDVPLMLEVNLGEPFFYMLTIFLEKLLEKIPEFTRVTGPSRMLGKEI